MKEQNTWTLNDSAQASNPGNIKVNLIRWMRFYPKWPSILFGSFALFLMLAIFIHWGFYLLAVPALILSWMYWRRVQDHFAYGCVNAGVVVSTQPMLIAVSTDLSKGIGEYPAIRIIEKSLPAACNQPPQIGSMLPLVALYQPSPDVRLPHWESFDPRPVECATGNRDTIQRSFESLTDSDWTELKSHLRQVPRPFQCGLYHVKPDAKTE